MTEKNEPKLWYLVGRHLKPNAIFHSKRSELPKWTSLTPGFKTREELVIYEGILDDPCKICGGIVKSTWSEPLKTEIIKKNICHSCHFWMEKVDVVNDKNIVRIGGEHYTICAESKDAGYFRGFGGRKFVVLFNDSRKITTTNLWSQGTIPERFKELLPDNAIFIADVEPEIPEKL